MVVVMADSRVTLVAGMGHGSLGCFVLRMTGAFQDCLGRHVLLVLILRGTRVVRVWRLRLLLMQLATVILLHGMIVGEYLSLTC